MQLAVLGDNVQRDNIALLETSGCSGHAAQAECCLAIQKLVFELGEDVLLQVSLIRIIAGNGLDEPNGKLLVHIVILQPRRPHQRAVFLNDAVDAPKMVFHDGIALSNGVIVFQGI